jgi:hypothetical protein
MNDESRIGNSKAKINGIFLKKIESIPKRLKNKTERKIILAIKFET